MQVYNAIDKSKYKVYPIYISKKGEWFTGDNLLKIENLEIFQIYQRFHKR